MEDRQAILMRRNKTEIYIHPNFLHTFLALFFAFWLTTSSVIEILQQTINKEELIPNDRSFSNKLRQIDNPSGLKCLVLSLLSTVDQKGGTLKQPRYYIE